MQTDTGQAILHREFTDNLDTVRQHCPWAVEVVKIDNGYLPLYHKKLATNGAAKMNNNIQKK